MAGEALPDFLVISPPDVGSDWLAANLDCHPRIFIPDCRRADEPAGQVLTRGRVVQRLGDCMPASKLICLTGESAFDQPGAWLDLVPREQIFVARASLIRGQPAQLLTRIFEFLGVSAVHDFSFFKIAKVGKHVPRTRDQDYFGHRLVHYRRQFFGIARELDLDLRNATEKEIVRLEEDGLLFRSPSLDWVKLHVAEQQLAPLYRPPGKPSLALRARRYLRRRLGGFASGIAGKIQALSPRVVARLKPASRGLRQST